MDFTLSKQHEMARTLFKEFAEKEVKPLAQEVDETEVFPRGTVEKMAKAGFLGIPVPKEYGGQGCDTLTYAMCVEELSKVCATTGVIVSAHTSLCIDPIMTFGTEEQKQKYVPDLASGRKIGAFGLTEPGAGTDAQGQQEGGGHRSAGHAAGVEGDGRKGARHEKAQRDGDEIARHEEIHDRDARDDAQHRKAARGGDRDRQAHAHRLGGDRARAQLFDLFVERMDGGLGVDDKPAHQHGQRDEQILHPALHGHIHMSCE